MLSSKNIRFLGYGVLLLVFLKIWFFEVPYATFVDLSVYYEAGKKILLHQTVYDVPGHFQYKYSPWISLLFGASLSSFQFQEVSLLFYRLLLLGWMAYAFWVDFKMKPRVPASFFLLLFLYNALVEDLKLGQVNAFALGSFTALYFLLRKKTLMRQCLAGFFLCVAVSFKLSLLIAVPFLFFRRLGLTLVSALLSYLILGVGVASLTLGTDFVWSEHLAWISTLTQSTSELLAIHENISLLGMLMKASHDLAFSSRLWMALVVGFVFLQWRFRKEDMDFQLGFQGVSMVLLSPIAWPYWSLFALPALLRQSHCLVNWATQSVRHQIIAGALTLVFVFILQTQMRLVLYGPRTLGLVMILLGLIKCVRFRASCSLKPV